MDLEGRVLSPHNFFYLGPLTPISGQDIISPYDIKTISSGQIDENKEKYKLDDY